MIKFTEFIIRKQFSITVNETRILLSQINVNSDNYLNYLFDHEELWDKDPAKVLNEFNPVSAGWSAVKGGFSAMGSSRNAAYYQKLLDQALVLRQSAPDKLVQAGLTANDLITLDTMQSKSKAQGGTFFSGMKRGWKDSREQQVLNKLNKVLGKQTQGQGQQQPQQQQQNYGTSTQQVSQVSQPQGSQVNQNALQQAQTHLQALNQVLSRMLNP